MSEFATLDRRARATRDRLVDLLGMGSTAPLADLPVRVQPPKVTFGGDAAVLVDETQADVDYELRDKDGKEINGEMRLLGNSVTISFGLNAIQEKTSFTIWAEKKESRRDKTERRGAELRVRPEVDVGLSSELSALFQNSSEPALMTVDFAGSVTVDVFESQAGGQYRLVAWPTKDAPKPDDLGALAQDEVFSSGDWVSGNGGTISLLSKPFTTDTLLRVRVQKAAALGGAETTLLTAPLPVLVRPDPALTLALVPADPPVFGATPALRIRGASKDVQYRVFLRPLRDAEFNPDLTQPDSVEEVVTLAVAAGLPDITLKKPALPLASLNPPGFNLVQTDGRRSRAGLDLVLAPLTSDSLAFVLATKRHDEAMAGRVMESVVALTAMPIILVRPNPAPDLILLCAAGPTGSTGAITLLGGEPGVSYTIRIAPNGPDLAMAGYIHRRDDDEKENKGLGRLRLGLDFILADELLGKPGDLNFAFRPPAPPRLEAPALPFGTSFLVTARRVRTGLEATFSALLELTEPSKVQFDTGATHVVVADSRVNQLHTLLRGGIATKPSQGTGADLSLEVPDGRGPIILRITEIVPGPSIGWEIVLEAAGPD